MAFYVTLFCLLILGYSRVALSTYVETRKWSILSKLKLSKLGYTHSDVISAASPGFVHLFWYVAMVIWTGIEFISVENVMQNLSLLETLLYCAADGSDTKSDDDTNNGWSGDAESDDEEAFFDTKDALKSFESIQKQTSVSEVNMELVGLNYPEVRWKKSLPQPKEKENSVSLWSMIKDNIGKDLSKICLPVYFNEPI